MRFLTFRVFVVCFGLNFSLYFQAQNLNLVIKGKTQSETKVIDSLGYQKTFKNYKLLNEALFDFQKRIEHLGFIENEMVYLKKSEDSLYEAKLDLKKRFYTIYIYYDKNSISEDIIKFISDKTTSTYFVTSISKSEAVLNYISKSLIEDGSVFTSIQLEDIRKKDAQNLEANLIVLKSKKRTVDDIIVKGYKKFPKSYLKHFLKLKPNDVFNLNTIIAKSETLNNLRFANQVKTPEVLFTTDSTSIYLFIKKKKSNTFDGFLGFGTNEMTNKLEFDGYLNLNLINNLNYGEAINLSYKSDENEQKTFNANFELPFLFGSPVGTTLRLNIFRKDSTFTTVSQFASVFYQINSNQKIHLGVDAVQSNYLLSSTTPNIADFNSTHFNTRFEYIKPKKNNLLFPFKTFLDLKAGLGNRKVNNTQEQQLTFALDGFNIINLNAKNSIFLRIQSAGVLSDSFLENELVRFGGINSIRGFEENSLLASLFTVINSEYRYQLSSSIYVHTIFDASYLENELSKVNEKFFGLGFGFGILTKAGLLKFNYANGKSEGNQFNFSNSKIHLSLRSVF